MGIKKRFGSSYNIAKKPRKKRSFMEIPWCLCHTTWNNGRTELTIYNTENRRTKVKLLDAKIILDQSTSITQLPNGELFCYGSWTSCGITLIIDRSYEVRILSSGTRCFWAPVIYYNNNIYCFGGSYAASKISISRKFDLEKNRWINLAKLPNADYYCHSVIFNGNILISEFLGKNIWLYSIEIDSFSIIPYDFAQEKIKFIVNIGKLYLIEWGDKGLIYESEDEYHWNPISKSGKLNSRYQMYCLYNKDKVYISTNDHYYQFDLKKKVVLGC